MLLLYSPQITPRLRYIVEFIGRELFDEPITLTSDKESYTLHPGARLNYSDTDIDEIEFFLRSTPLLYQTGIHDQQVECFELNFHKAFFPTEGDFPFDIFAASFYLISRYEEYLSDEPDEYGRYDHTQSLAYKEGFLDIPLVNIWLQDFKRALGKKFPNLVFRYPSFKFIPTYDIDVAYSYLHKGWKRNLGGILRSLSRGRWPDVIQRINVLRGRHKDPYDAYEWLDSLHLYCRLRAYYFFLAAGRARGVDRNISPEAKGLQDLVRYHAAGCRVGIHPSWQAGDKESLLKEEKEWMESITGKQVIRSRQHYIRMTLPGTYRILLKHGIQQDFSMGYGSINGFRASVASSFYWYDLQREEKTSLRIFPFCFMDANSFFEQHDTPAQAMQELMQYYQLIRKVNGLMVTVWHNTFLGDDPQFTDWKNLYALFLKEEIFWDA
jgi:hypothetical protein